MLKNSFFYVFNKTKNFYTNSQRVVAITLNFTMNLYSNKVEFVQKKVDGEK